MELENFDSFRLPVFIRVIGFGDETKSTIDAINKLGYEGLDAVVATPGAEFSPSVDDKMAIFLATGHNDRLPVVAKTYFEADVLTIAIVADSSLSKDVKMDSVTIETPDRMYEVVRTLIGPIFMYGYVRCDFSDLSLILTNSGHFSSFTVIGSGPDRVAQAVESIRCRLADAQLMDAEHICLFMYFNNEGSQPVRINELAVLNDFFSELSNTIDLIWAAYSDKTIKDDAIKISLIVSGANLHL